jgi:hypothetical protein
VKGDTQSGKGDVEEGASEPYLATVNPEVRKRSMGWIKKRQHTRSTQKEDNMIG